MEKKRILIVDTDPQVLEGFRGALGEEWELIGVESGKAALAAMKERPCDVFVASVDLPEISGTELLNRIRKRFPKTARFILAAEEDRDRVVKRLLGAHQFLSKPLDPATLRSTLERARALDSWMENQGVRDLVGRVRTVPAVPSLYLEVLDVLRSPHATAEEVGAIIAKDMAMTTKLLQVLNSAYFGFSRKITDPAEAVGLLGFSTVKSMVVAVKMLGQYDKCVPEYFSIDKLWRHSTEVARIARKLTLAETNDRSMADTAYTAGLLHDVGKVFLASNFGEQYEGVQSLAQKQHVSLWEVEKEVFGASHGEISAYLLGLWGMPLDLVEAAAFHHRPRSNSGKGFTPLTAVHVANALEHELNPDEDELFAPAIDQSYLDEIGLSNRVEDWREIAGIESAGEPEPAVVVTPPADDSQNADPIPPASDSPAAESGDPVRVPQAAFAPIRWRLYLGVAAAVLLFLFGTIAGYLLSSSSDDPLGTTVAVNPEPSDESAGTGLSAGDSGRSSPEMVAEPDEVAAGPAHSGSLDRINPVSGNGSTLEGYSGLPGGPGGENVARPATGSVEDSSAFPDMRLQVIYFSRERPAAVINGEVVYVDDRVSGALVVEINRTDVLLEFESQRKRLHIIAPVLNP